MSIYSPMSAKRRDHLDSLILIFKIWIVYIGSFQTSILWATQGPWSLSLNINTCDVDYEEVILQVQREFINLQYSQVMKTKFLACYILIFSKNYVLPSGQFSNLITKQVVCMFVTTYHSEHLFYQMKYAKSLLN